MPNSAGQRQVSPRRTWVVTAFCLIGVFGQLAIALLDPEHIKEYGFSTIRNAILYAGLATVQCGAVVLQRLCPRTVFVVVTAMDLVIRVDSGGKAAIGSFAITVMSWGLVRDRLPHRHTMLAIGAAIAAIGSALQAHEAQMRVLAALLFIVLHVAQTYLLPAAVGEYMLGRERLHRALRDKAELLEKNEHEQVERRLRASRNALARDLHDIAGHHLSGIMISAQAASTLASRDPDRAQQTLLMIEDGARTALADLRRTVGLLRSDDDGEENPQSSSVGNGPRPVPSLEQVPHLIEEARRRGQRNSYVVNGEARPLSLLAETAAYRMVQESLANSARHAPGSACQVLVTYQAE